MGFDDLTTFGNRSMLQVFGKPITLQHRATRRDIIGIPSDISNPGSPVDGIPAHESHSISVDQTSAAGVDTNWTATNVKTGITRQVIAVSDPEEGFVTIHLGEKIGRVCQ